MEVPIVGRDDDPGMPPLWPWLEVSRSVPVLAGALGGTYGEAGGTGPQEDSSSARFVMFAAASRALASAAAERGLLVVLEDLQWADRTSLLLRHLAGELGRGRLLVMTTFRETTGSEAAGPPLAELLAALLRAGARPVRLTGLSRPDIARWLRLMHAGGNVDELAGRLRAGTGGNPLFVRMLVERGPGAVDGGLRRGDDPDALLDGIHARHLSLCAPQFLAERRELATRACQVAVQARQPLDELWGHAWLVEAALQAGDLAAVDDELGRIEQFATYRRHGVAWWHLHRLRATRAALVGDLAAASGHNEAARAVATQIGAFSMTGMYHSFNNLLAHLRGTIDRETGEEALAVLRQAPGIPLVRVFVPLIHALLGDRDLARATFEEFPAHAGHR